jgi:hypothetical protein
MTQLYSFNGQEPKEIPDRIRFPGGSTKTDRTTFSEQDLINAGYIGPFDRPEYDPQKQELVWDSETLSYKINDFPVPPEPTQEDYLFQLRVQRNGILSATDWAVMPDSPLSEEKKQEWVEYRQLLRDLPENTIDFSDVTWPEEPTL